MIRTIIATLITVIMLFVLPVQAGVFAYAENQESGSITVIMKNKLGEALTGAGISVYHIADLQSSNSASYYTKTEAFASSGIPTPVNMTAEENISTSAKLVTFIQEKNISTGTALVGQDGNARIAGLQPGLYLIRQTVSLDGYRDITSFLVSLPVTSPQGDSLAFQLTVTPKVLGVLGTGITPTPGGQTPGGPKVSGDDDTGVLSGSRLPQTGLLMWPVILLAVAGLAFISIGWVDQNLKRKKK